MSMCVRIAPLELMPYKNIEAKREYQRNWVAKRKSEWFLNNGPCVKCASWADLELDHIDPDTKVTNSIWSWSEKRREEELAKCQILCSKCHKKKTKAYMSKLLSKNPPHGDIARYRKGCRCEDCYEGLRQWWRDYRI